MFVCYIDHQDDPLVHLYTIGLAPANISSAGAIYQATSREDLDYIGADILNKTCHGQCSWQMCIANDGPCKVCRTAFTNKKRLTKMGSAQDLLHKEN